MHVFEPVCIIVTLCGLEKSQFKLLTTAECPFSFSNVEYSYCLYPCWHHGWNFYIKFVLFPF